MKKGDIVLFRNVYTKVWEIGVFQEYTAHGEEVRIGLKNSIVMEKGRSIPFKGNEHLLFTDSDR